MKLALFLEDQGHQFFVEAIVKRIASDEGVEAEIDTRNAVGGSRRAVATLRTYLRDLARGQTASVDVVVAAIDGNCQGVNDKVSQLRTIATDAAFAGTLVCAVPDPHVEAWYMSDGHTVAVVAGEQAIQSALPAAKCEKEFYKHQLNEVFNSVGVNPPLGGVEYGGEIARMLDLGSACRHSPSFERFRGELVATFRQLGASGLE